MVATALLIINSFLICSFQLNIVVVVVVDDVVFFAFVFVAATEVLCWC